MNCADLPFELTALILQYTREPLLCASVCRQWRELIMTIARSECAETIAVCRADNSWVCAYARPREAKKDRGGPPLGFTRYLLLRADTLEDCRLVARLLECDSQRSNRIFASGAMWRFLSLAQPAASTAPTNPRSPAASGPPVVGSTPTVPLLRPTLNRRQPPTEASDAELLLGASIITEYTALLGAIARRRIDDKKPLCSTELLCRAVCYGMSLIDLRDDFRDPDAPKLTGLIEEILLRHDLAAVSWDLRACVRYAIEHDYKCAPVWSGQLIPPFAETNRHSGGWWLSTLPIRALARRGTHEEEYEYMHLVLLRTSRYNAAVVNARSRAVYSARPEPPKTGRMEPPEEQRVYEKQDGDLRGDPASFVALGRLMRDKVQIIRLLTFAEFDGELHFVT